MSLNARWCPGFFLVFIFCTLVNNGEGSLEIIHKRSETVGNKVFQGIFTQGDIKELSVPSGKLPSEKFVITCYYNVPGSSNDLKPENIDASLCTHIIVGFSSVIDGKLLPDHPNDVVAYKQTTGLKTKNPSLKVMLTVGGGGNNNGFSDAFSTSEKRAKFIESAISLLNQYNFDGLDVDWEFPVWNDNIFTDKSNFILFLKEFKSASRRIHTANGLLLSVAVGAPKGIIDSSYDVLGMAKYIDFINLMSYDYHDYFWYYPFTGHNSPLFKRKIEKAYFGTLNTNWSALYWSQEGMPKSKIIVGIPTYAHTYKLLDSKYHDFDSPAVGYGIGNGELSYPQVCQFLEEGGISVFDEESQVPYAYKGLDWVAYDDFRSVAAKARWIKSQGFGGAMTYDLNCDDWNATCNGITKFPLHKIIHSILKP